MPKTILIVEDEKVLRESMAELLTDEGYIVVQAGDGKEAYDIVLKQSVDLVLSDIRMPEMDGMTLLGLLTKTIPDTPIIMVTAYGTVENAVSAIRQGAFDYLLKPVQLDDVVLRVKRALEYGELAKSTKTITEQLADDSKFHNLVGNSQPMQKLFDMIRKLSSVKSNVLIIGESGTGKELIARAVHYNGVTRDKPFVAVNCGAIPEPWQQGVRLRAPLVLGPRHRRAEPALVALEPGQAGEPLALVERREGKQEAVMAIGLDLRRRQRLHAVLP